jgi:membrane protein DedA with SNARE-associated domain
MLKSMIGSLVDWYNNALETMGVPVVGLMMALESTVVPIPSEVIIPPAAHYAHTHPGGKVTIAGIILAGIIGSWVGAAIMYWVSRLAGRPLIERYGKFVLISPEKVAGAERWTAHYGALGVFVSRLLPVVRHLIGIPAGIVRMNFWKYSVYTILGAGVWSGVLCWLGITIGGQISKGEMTKVTLSIAAVLAVLCLLYYFFVHRQMKAGAKTA